MKIFLCLHHFLPDFIGGTEIYTFNLAKYLIQKNVVVGILVPNLGIDKTEEYFYEGVKVIKYAEDSIEDRQMILGKKKPLGLQEFASIIKKEKPDIVHFHELAPGRGISIFHVEKVHELKIPLVITFHVSYYTCFKGSLVYKDKEKCDGEIDLEKCTTCIYQQKHIKGVQATVLQKAAMGLHKFHIDATAINGSIGTALGLPYIIEKIKKDLLRLFFFAEKIIVIADWYKKVLEKNGIDNSKIIYIKQGLPDETKKMPLLRTIDLPLKVVYIGRISKLKGLHLLIEALNCINEAKISLDVYGTGDESGYFPGLKELTRNSKNIHWKGSIPPREVVRTLSAYHVLCLPSAFEMSPLVIQEAFAAGIPVLASDVYGNAEQIKDGENGWIFKFNNSHDLAVKLEYLINDVCLIKDAMARLPAVNSFKEVGDAHLAAYSLVSQQPVLL